VRGKLSLPWTRRRTIPQLDWVSRPTEPRRFAGLRARLGALLPRLFTDSREACPFCLRPVHARATRCPHCREDLALDHPLAALGRLGVAWPAAEISAPEALPEGLGNADPERLRLRELVEELLIAPGDAFGVLRCLANPQTSAAVERYPHQLATVRRALGELRGRALLADEVGLGKTIEAGLILAELRARNLCRHALVLVPPALLDQWHGELTEKLGLPVTRIHDRRQWENPPGIALVSSYTAKGPGHRAAILRQAWDLVIVDEAHRLRNPRTQAHRFVRGLPSRYLLLLTATPLQSSLQDLHTLANLIRPGLLGTPRQFRAQFGVSGDGRGVRQSQRLRGVLREVMIRNRRATAGVTLPPRRAAIRWVDLSPEERTLHNAAIEALRNEPARRQGFQSARLAAVQRRLTSTPEAVTAVLSWITDPARRIRLEGSVASTDTGEKVWALAELLRLYPDERVLVFSEFAESVEAITAQLAGWGESVVGWHGRRGPAERQAALAAFRSGGCRILVGSDALAEGQNLQHCRIIVNFDLPWNPFRIEQRIGRVHRLGQRREVFVLTLVARDTFEAQLACLFVDKLRLFELSVGELDPVIGDLVDSEVEFDSFLSRIALAESRDRERELSEFARRLEDGYLRHRDLEARQAALPELSALGAER
jgi:superfamily II DNA or RNA helicase